MKKVLTGSLIALCVVGVLWVAKGWTLRQNDPKVAKFHADAEGLILGLQQYREFTGSYPTGNNIQITKALLGRTEKKIMILSVHRADINDKGEIMDPWRTPLQFYFSNNEVMIRSAGPNRAWEDSSSGTLDDLYRTASYEKK